MRKERKHGKQVENGIGGGGMGDREMEMMGVVFSKHELGRFSGFMCCRGMLT